MALSALKNDRWHHTAASRALVEQLSPMGGSFFANKASRASSASLSGMYKSASDLHQTSIFSVGNGASLEDVLNSEIPSAAPSSGSDSSSELADVAMEKEECEEWAAAVIADVTLDRSRIR